MPALTQIKCPKGIRFDCSGCSNCCLQWPVPLTQEDYERISNKNRLLNTQASFRNLRSSKDNLLAFTHTLEKNDNGSCEFLAEDKRCRLHLEYGIEAKPSMCMLFPYSFTVTPDEVLATLSFASSAVLYNNGRLLSEQNETLESQFQVFSRLFKPNTKLWHQLQIIDGQPLNWNSFKEIDNEILSLAERKDQTSAAKTEDEENVVPRNLNSKLVKIGKLIQDKLGNPALAERDPPFEAKPAIADQILLKHLDRLYFPSQVFAEDKYDLDARALVSELVTAPHAVSFGKGNTEIAFSDLVSSRLNSLPDETDELIDRFLYVRVFSKLYFGPGFHHLSLLSGLNHLRLLSTLIRLKIKQSVVLKLTSTPTGFDFVCELVRTLERRLTQLDLSAPSQAMLEVLLSSPERQNRISQLAE